MRYFEINEIKRDLEILSKEKMPIWYEVAKNLRICNKLINDTQEIVKEMHSNFADKNADGSVKQYEQDGQQMARISDPIQLEAYKAELMKIELEEHDVKFHKILISKLEGFNIEASKILSLVDTIIVESLVELVETTPVN